MHLYLFLIKGRILGPHFRCKYWGLNLQFSKDFFHPNLRGTIGSSKDHVQRIARKGIGTVPDNPIFSRAGHLHLKWGTACRHHCSNQCNSRLSRVPPEWSLVKKSLAATPSGNSNIASQHFQRQFHPLLTQDTKHHSPRQRVFKGVLLLFSC